MAQRTAAERFLRSSVKAASARVFLALAAAAALALAGCGGGSSADSASSAASSDSTSGAAQKQGDAPAAGSAEEEGSKTGRGGDVAKKTTGANEEAGEGGAPAPQAHQKKQGPGIAQPKGPPEQAPSSDEVAQATVADIALQSPAILAANGQLGRLAPTYTCDGNDTWPAFSWSGVPAGSAELILYAMNIQPVEGKLFVDWAVAGLDPGLTGIDSGQLPKGATVGTNSFGKRGYDMCPAGGGETYMFALYALPRSLSPAKGFDARELRRQILDVSGNVGLLPAVYERG